MIRSLGFNERMQSTKSCSIKGVEHDLGTNTPYAITKELKMKSLLMRSDTAILDIPQSKNTLMIFCHKLPVIADVITAEMTVKMNSFRYELKNQLCII